MIANEKGHNVEYQDSDRNYTVYTYRDETGRAIKEVLHGEDKDGLKVIPPATPVKAGKSGNVCGLPPLL